MLRDPGRLILATVVIGVRVGLGATGFHFVADRFGAIGSHFPEVMSAGCSPCSA